MPTHNQTKYKQITEDADVAYQRSQFIGEERRELMGKKPAAKAVLEAAQEAEADRLKNKGRYVYTKKGPSKLEVEQAERTLARIAELDEKYARVCADFQAKRGLADRLTDFLIKKGVRDEVVLAQVQGDPIISNNSKGRQFK